MTDKKTKKIKIIVRVIYDKDGESMEKIFEDVIYVNLKDKIT